MQIVNGYACANCRDVSLAKRGVDPHKPETDPLRPEGRVRKDDPFGEAVQRGGSLTDVSATSAADRAYAAATGSTIDILA
jgi:hypothetical protein